MHKWRWSEVPFFNFIIFYRPNLSKQILKICLVDFKNIFRAYWYWYIHYCISFLFKTSLSVWIYISVKKNVDKGRILKVKYLKDCRKKDGSIIEIRSSLSWLIPVKISDFDYVFLIYKNNYYRYLAVYSTTLKQ